MKVLISGSHGMVGSALVKALAAGADEVTRLVRKPAPGEGPEIPWEPESNRLDPSSAGGFDAVVHLAGENIASGRWTDERKRRIRESRVKGTRLLSEVLARVARPPRVLVSASAIGYYGDRGEEILREESASGPGFLPEVCREWEAATEPAAGKGVRVVRLRFGVILSADGGALAKMLPPFRMGAGGILGDGRQYVSWISLDDAVGAIRHVIRLEALKGPVNVVAPAPVTNREFTATLGKVLSRPTLIPMPAFAARLAFGEMADALLLSSARVEPRRLLDSGYSFLHPDLEPALRHLLA
jgi:uncharacterized protein